MPDTPAIRPWEGRARADALFRVKARGARANTPCCLCHQPIDYTLRYPHPQSCSVQHIISRSIRPDLTWDPANWAPAHIDCNKAAGDGTNTRTNTNLGVTSPLWTTQGQPITEPDPEPATRPAAPAPDRLVVLLCGPPGAGKTTAANQSGG